MKKGFLHFYIIAILLPCYFLAGCSMTAQDSNIKSTGEQTTEYTSEQTDEVDSSEISFLDVTQTPSRFEPETSGEIDFRYIYRGFTAVPLNDSEMLERFMEFGEQTIATEEEWSAFMASYCPGIPYDEPWDFSEDYLLAYITEGASPAYTNSNTITSLVWEDGRFKPEYENDPANFVYALNSEEYTHFYVEVIALSRDIYASEGEKYQSVSPEKTATEAVFKTVFRGFTMVSLDDREIFERFSGFGTKVISTEENWNAFKSAFCPGIPCNESVDFTSHGLIVSVMMGARPTYIGASKIFGMDPEYGCPLFEDSVTNCIYAVNTENYTHFYVAVIKLPRERIADNLEVWISRS